MIDLIGSGDWGLAGAALAAIVFVQASIIIVVALVVTRAMRRRGPSFRSAVLRGALVTTALCPMVYATVEFSGRPGLRVIPSPQFTSHQPERNPLNIASLNASSNVSLPKRIESYQSVNSVVSAGFPQLSAAAPIALTHARTQWVSKQLLARLFTGLWVAISILLFARLVIAAFRAISVRRRALLAPSEMNALCRSLADQLSIRAPRLLVSEEISGPCLIGWLRPAILLPPEQQNAEREIMIHELAHQARRDCAWHLLARCTAALLWFQPLIWILMREIERTAEEACDDVVLEHQGDRNAYVDRLADLAEQARFGWTGAGVGVVGMRSSVGKRIQRLLATASVASTRLSWRMRAGIAIAVVGIATGLGAMRTQERERDQSAGAPKPGEIQKTGRIFDVDGKPVGGVDVCAIQPTGFESTALATNKSDAAGNFTLTFKSPSFNPQYVEVQAFAPGKGVAVASSDPAHRSDLSFLPTTQITLTVLGPDRKPAVGLRVFPIAFISSHWSPFFRAEPHAIQMFFRMPPELSRQMAATTDADGKVTLKDIPCATRFELGFDDDRFARPTGEERVLVSDTQPVSDSTTIKLQAGASISGVVRFEQTGRPASGIQVYCQATHRSRRSTGGYATTNETGEYVIKQIGAGEFNVMIRGLTERSLDLTSKAHEGVTLDAGQNLTAVDFSLIKGGIVTGRVTFADTGKPVTDTQIGAQGASRPQSSASVESVLVNADGVYRLRVPPGMQHVYVMGLLPPAYWPEKQGIHDVKVGDGEIVTADFKVERRPGSPVDGVVVGPDDKPLAGIQVRAETRLIYAAGGFLSTKTDAQGRFHFDGLTPGTPIGVGDGEWGAVEKTTVPKEAGPIQLKLKRRNGITIPGQIIDEDGHPIPGAQIRVTQMFETFGTTIGDPIIADKDGKFDVKNLYADSRYHITAEAEGFGEGQSQLYVWENPRGPQTLKLPRANAMVGGTVVDSSGNPIAGVIVHLNPIGAIAKTTVADPRGQFSFRVVPGKEYLIWTEVKDSALPRPSITAAAGQLNLKLVVPDFAR